MIATSIADVTHLKRSLLAEGDASREPFVSELVNEKASQPKSSRSSLHGAGDR